MPDAEVVVQSRLRSVTHTDVDGRYRALASAGRVVVVATKLGFLWTMVEKDIPSARAAERLVDLIKREGKWVEPPSERQLVPTTEHPRP